jgi:hypothetical protein
MFQPGRAGNWPHKIFDPKLVRDGRFFKTILLSGVLLSFARSVPAQTNVVTQHYDNARTGANANETILTPSNVNTSLFGKLFSRNVDGYVYAQPLYMAGVTMGAGTSQSGSTHNVVFIATEHDSVYAFDADSDQGANAQPLWKITLLDAAHGAAANATTVPAGDATNTDLVPEIGITGTPVIDPATNTIYVIGKTKENLTYVQRLHALDVTTGAEKFSGPVSLTAAVPGNGVGSSGGTLHFDPLWENQRTGLLLQNGIVYFGFGAHEDNGPWHGWILAYNATTLQQTGVWCASPNQQNSGIWMSGSGLAANVPDPINHPYGQMFTVTGNGTFDAVPPYNNTMDFGDSIIKLDLTNGAPTMISNGTTVGDAFTPHDQDTLNSTDTDQASGGLLLLPDSASGGQHLLTQVGKTGRVYVLDQTNLGGYHPSNTTDPGEKANVNGMWSMPAYWNGNLYFWGSGDTLKAFSFVNGIISTNPTSASMERFNFPGATPVVSANGTSNGIVWDIRPDAFDSQGREILYAHNASNVASLLYSSEQNPARDNPGGAVKFVVPAVVNGKVYVGAEYQVSVYGLFNGRTQAATPMISPGSQTFNPAQPLQVTITDSTPGVQIYYTTDGSTPTTTSTVYSGPLLLTSSETIQAIAEGTGVVESSVATATYTAISQVATPVIAPGSGTYTATQAVSITDTTPGATISYTLDGSQPTTASAKYVGWFPVAASTTVKAIATSPNFSNSATATSTMNIQNAGSGLFLVHAGGGKYTDLLGQVWSADNSFTGGSGSNTTSAIQNTSDPALYQTERYGPFSYNFTVPNGNYTVLLKFAEIYFTAAGKRVFNVSINGTPVLTNFDIVAAAGAPLKALDESFPVAVTNGTITVQFITGTSNWPKVSAIEIQGGGSVGVQISPTTVNLTASQTQQFTPTVTGTTNTNVTWSLSPAVGTVSSSGLYTAPSSITSNQAVSVIATSVADTTKTATATVNLQTTSAAATPVITPGTGTYSTTQTVTITDGTSGATIYYTLDGSQPTTASTRYAGSFSVTASTTVKAIATATNFSTSATAISIITIQGTTGAPLFLVHAGGNKYTDTLGQVWSADNSFTGGSGASTTSTIQNTSDPALYQTERYGAFSYNFTVPNGNYTVLLKFAEIYFTAAGQRVFNVSINGTLVLTNFDIIAAAGAPLTALDKSFPVTVTNGTITVQFITGSSNWPKVSAVEIQSSAPAATPAFSLPGGTYLGTQTVSISDTTPGSTIFYTLDGSVPATSVGGSTQQYGSAITVSSTETINAIAVASSYTTSAMASAAYTIQSQVAAPTFSPGSGTYSAAQQVSIGTTTAGATIYYTTNGTTPTTASTQYTGPIAVNTSETVEAMAAESGFFNSSVSMAAYTITPPAATPVIAPGTGTYSTTQTVTITDGTSGAVIYYTLDGSQPTTGSTKYLGSFSVTASTTVKAIATAANFSTSATATSVITIQGTTGAPLFLVHAGGNKYTDTLGQVWSADNSFTGGSGASTTSTIQNTSDPALYQTERYGAFSYNFTVPNGNYTVLLKFAEIYFTAAGKRVFNVSINGTPVLTNFDIVAVAGAPLTALDESFPVAVTNGTITVQFITGTSNWPKVSAIEIQASTPAATPVIAPGTGTYSTTQTVTITDGTSGATIYYTLDGSPPTTSSSKYVGSFPVNTSTTVKAIATATNYSTSAAATSVITIQSSSGAGLFLVHAGGGQYADSLGQVWSADNSFTGGSGASTTSTIQNTSDPALYQTERYGAFSYNLTVPNGNYTVLLKFAEIYFTAAGQRVFNVSINGTPVLTNFDIVAVAGAPLKALDESFPVAVTNGTINIQFSPGTANWPKVSAIKIY